METSYLKTLELDKIIARAAEGCVCKESREKLLALEPQCDPDEVRYALEQTDAINSLLIKNGSPRFGGVEGVSQLAARAVKGGVLSMGELLMVAGALRNFQNLVSWYGSSEHDALPTDDLFYALAPQPGLEQQISSAILAPDAMADTASHTLNDLRKKIRATENSIRDRLESMVRNMDTSKYLQESVVSIRNGRYVVPVKSEYRGEVSGIIHDVSSTGATVFVEPQAVVEANARILQYRAQEAQEIERILVAFTGQVAAIEPQFQYSYKAMLEIDVLLAKARLALDMKAFKPTVRTDASFSLIRARHPLIDAKKCVPVDISLGRDYDSLIITGPNTGGKTVTLKTAGLLCAMAQCGFLIPADERSEICVFDEFLVDIGDEQSIEQSLSTFSGHMKKITGILELAMPCTLVLLDELGAGTDPAEGAALAVSVLTELKERHAKVCATTHYQEVKMFALQTEGVENASCEFDVNTLKPTYRLIVGVPGKSNAFAISQRLGMPDDVIERAKELVSTENKRFEQVVDALEKSRQELEALKESAAVSERNAKLTESELKQKLSELEQQKEKELESARQRALSIVEETRFRSNQLLNELEELKKVKDKEALRQGLSSMKGKTNSTLNKMQDEANPVVERRAESYVLPRPLKAGDTVMLADTKKEGVLMTVPNMSGVCYVQVGMMKIKTNQKNLRLVDNKKKQPTPQKSVGGSVKKQVTANMNRRGGMELDIRGMMTDEGVLEMERFIDSAQLSGISTVIIIHGKGTGALRAAVQQALKTNPAVKSYRQGAYGEGEAGVTVVELK